MYQQKKIEQVDKKFVGQELPKHPTIGYDNFTTGSTSVKAEMLDPLHVLGHQPPKMYTSCLMTINQLDMVNASIAPGVPKFSLLTKIQDNNT